MGQRLVITLYDKNKEKLASIYYHWSGYTTSSAGCVALLSGLYFDLLEIEGKEARRKYIAAYLESQHGIFMSGRSSDNTNITGNKDLGDRNVGIYKIDDKGIEEMISCGEEFVDVNVDTKTITFDVWCQYDEGDISDSDNVSPYNGEYDTFTYDTAQDILGWFIRIESADDVLVQQDGDNKVYYVKIE